MTTHLPKFHADGQEPGFERPDQFLHGSTEKFTKAELARILAGPWYRDEDRESSRFSGKWTCLVCGMRSKTKREAVACCAALVAGKPSPHENMSSGKTRRKDAETV